MIAGVRGTLEAIGRDWVHLQVGGVTLQIFVPESVTGELGPVGAQVHFYTHLRIRDDQVMLYGFPTQTALGLFLMLDSVSGVGPRLALSLLSSLGPPRLQQAIATGDVSALSAAPGVGRRTASRIILELKGKLETEELEGVPAAASDDAEVIAALTALGYSATEARQAVSKLDRSPDLTLEERIRLALQQFGGGG